MRPTNLGRTRRERPTSPPLELVGHGLSQKVIDAGNRLFFFHFPHPAEHTGLFFFLRWAIAPGLRLVAMSLSSFRLAVVERVQEVAGVVHPFFGG